MPKNTKKGVVTPAVGYGKPPVARRFKPGQSGNPKGRPKGSKNLKSIVEREFDKKISMREGEKTRELTKKEAIVTATINRGLQKGGKDGDTALRLMALVDQEATDVTAEAPLTADDQEILAAYEARRRAHFMEELAACAALCWPAPIAITDGEHE